LPKAAWIALAALAGVWWMSIRMLWTEWEVDPQYGYGFLVPFLCGILFVQRWRERPEPWKTAQLLAPGVAALPPLLFLLAAQPFYEANPEWRIPGILGAFSAVFLTLLLLYAVGGPSWAGHFLFPVCFFLIAIPWPRNAEEAIMGFFMEKNAMAALEVLHWFGYEAMRRGHLITLPTGTLGVEEACSGVRSLQSGIMTSLFFGEIFRFGIFFRSVLLSISLFVALFGNFLRATFLSIIASNEGVAAVEKWHDFAGYAILASTLVTLWAIAWFYDNRRTKKNPSAKASKPFHATPPSIPRPVVTACVCTVLLAAACLAGTEVWYRSHEADVPAEGRWSIKSGTAGTKPVPIPDRTRRILFFPDGFSERFLDSTGRTWHFFFLRWPPGRTAIQALNIHDPRTCLASIGMVLEKQLPAMTIEAGGVRFPFRVFLFREAGRPVLVFHSVIAGGVPEAHIEINDLNSDGGEMTLEERWRVVTKGIRNRGQSMLEAAVWNTTDVSAAAEKLTDFLKRNMEVAEHP